MKKSGIIILCLLVFVLGSALGYRIGLRRALHKIGDEMESDQLSDAQFASQCEARGYLYSLQALDSGRAENITDLRKRGLSQLRIYVQGVQDLHNLGHAWTPDEQTFSNATAYLAEHPSNK